MVQIVVCQLRCHLSAAQCQLRCSVLAQHIAIVSWAAKCQLIGRLSASLRFASQASNAQRHSLGSNLSAKPHTVMDLQVCEPDLATASPSAIAGCADKLESCKVLYVPIGGPAYRYVGEVKAWRLRHHIHTIRRSDVQKSNASTSECFMTGTCCIWWLLTETSCSYIIDWS